MSALTLFVPCTTCRGSRYFWLGAVLGLLHTFNYSFWGGFLIFVTGQLAAHWLPSWPTKQ